MQIENYTKAAPAVPSGGLFVGYVERELRKPRTLPCYSKSVPYARSDVPTYVPT